MSGVEKKNDDLRRYFHLKINRWDAATNVLLIEKRQEVLRKLERTKQPYEKRNTSFWLEGGKEESARKVSRISTTAPEPLPIIQENVVPEQPPMEDMTESILKKKNVSQLIVLLEKKSRKSMNKRRRKQEIIDALLYLVSRSE